MGSSEKYVRLNRRWGGVKIYLEVFQVFKEILKRSVLERWRCPFLPHILTVYPRHYTGPFGNTNALRLASGLGGKSQTTSYETESFKWKRLT